MMKKIKTSLNFQEFLLLTNLIYVIYQFTISTINILASQQLPRLKSLITANLLISNLLKRMLKFLQSLRLMRADMNR